MLFGAWFGFAGVANCSSGLADFVVAGLDKLFYAFDEPVKVFVVHEITAVRPQDHALQSRRSDQWRQERVPVAQALIHD